MCCYTCMEEALELSVGSHHGGGANWSWCAGPVNKKGWKKSAQTTRLAKEWANILGSKRGGKSTSMIWYHFI